MKKEIRLNAFAMNCVAHQSPGLWTHPRDRTSEYNRLPYWIDLARTLERGRFDGLFLADVLGVYDVFGGSPDAALRNATQTPANDPLLLIPAMATVTEHLGFGVTSNLSYEPPYTFARRMSTLDHLTEGRIGWNVVTGYLDSAARGAGKEKQTAHDDRYDVADEYMDVVYRLWEGSWEDDAALRDRARGIFADPAKVHRAACCRDPSAGPRSRPQPGRNPDVQHDDHYSRPHRSGSISQIRRLCQPCQPRRRARADVRLDRRRFLDLRSRPGSPPRPERRRPQRDGQHHPRRSGSRVDRARGRPACRDRRNRAGAGRHARQGRRRYRSVVRADRRRRIERPVRDFAWRL